MEKEGLSQANEVSAWTVPFFLKRKDPPMFPFTLRNLIEPRKHYIWAQIRILHETNKAILVYCGVSKIWIPKSRIFGIRLNKNVFEIYVKERTIG